MKMRIFATCALVVACVVAGAQPAWSRTIDLRAAGEVATSAASGHGQIERVDCWRAMGPVHTRRRDAAICVVRVRTASGDGCYVIYELRLAGRRGQAVRITRGWAAWCASPGAPAHAASVESRRAARLVRRAARRYGDVGQVSCATARRASGRPIWGRAVCVAWMRSWPRCGVMYEVRLTARGLRVIATYVPWCASQTRWA
jgi:hypothetical protein